MNLHVLFLNDYVDANVYRSITALKKTIDLDAAKLYRNIKKYYTKRTVPLVVSLSIRQVHDLKQNLLIALNMMRIDAKKYQVVLCIGVKEETNYYVEDKKIFIFTHMVEKCDQLYIACLYAILRGIRCIQSQKDALDVIDEAIVMKCVRYVHSNDEIDLTQNADHSKILYKLKQFPREYKQRFMEINRKDGMYIAHRIVSQLTKQHEITIVKLFHFNSEKVVVHWAHLCSGCIR
ncbi:MAG: hypothetical protein ACRCWQ_10695 [Bacilli bacterium]